MPPYAPMPMLRTAFALLMAAALTACGGSGGDFDAPADFEAAETTVEYEAAVEGAPSEDIQALLESSLAIFRRQENGAQSIAFLRRRAESDVAIAQRILASFGYFRPSVSVRVEEVAPPEGEVPDEDALMEATATLIIEPGTAFTLERQTLTLIGFEPGPSPVLGPAEAYGAPIGMTAEAAPILAAESRALQAIREQGFFYAESGGRDSLADLEAGTLEVDSQIETGRRWSFGDLTIDGAPNISTDYLETYVPWQRGEPVDPAKLSEYQRALLATGLFRSGFVTLPEQQPDGPGGEAPVRAVMTEAPFRTVSGGVRYSTDEGPAVRGGFEHRNLLGAGERLNLTLDASLDEQVGRAEYRKPQFLRPRQDFVSSFELRRVDDDAFEELGTTVTAGLTRTLSDAWTVGAGGLLEASQITDEGEDETALLAGLPVFAAFDNTGDLLNPTEGFRLRAQVTPFIGSFDSSLTLFSQIDTTASAYLPFDDARRWVLAGRGRLGLIPSDSLDDVPATRRLYAGGSGSVRAFAEDFVGELDDDGDPVGGRSVVEAGLELRYPIWGDLGGVVFAEAGSVSPEVFPDFEEGVQVGVGGGIRYYSPVGPIRVDVAVPVDARDEDDAFQLYISIGQAF
ncbi:MAG: BamA/TamA family outer membrane protein [Pseudomonadota bacterium]